MWNYVLCESICPTVANPTALTPGDYDSQEDFDDAVLERLEIQKNFLLINKFLDNQINFAQPHIPKKK